jgi:hypothetical protein
MKKLGLAVAATAMVAFAGGANAGPSAKFAADWASGEAVLASIVNCAAVLCVDSSSDAEIRAAELMATIKVPQHKELLIGVSGEARLLTFTQAKGKKDGTIGSTSSDADLSLEVRVAPVDEDDVCVDAEGELAVPGPITFASRHQELTVSTTAGDQDVIVGLKLETVAAHHFNFIAVDLDSGEYNVWGCFSGDASVITGGASSGGLGDAVVAIQKRIVTVQEVRAVSGSIEGL